LRDMDISGGSANGSAAGAGRGNAHSYQDRQMEIQIQRAIEASLEVKPTTGTAAPTTCEGGNAPVPAIPSAAEDDLTRAIRESQREQEEQRRRQQEEEDTLRRVLELSMQEK